MRTKLQPSEAVALIVRKHWLVLMKPVLFLAAVLLYLPVRHVRILGFEALLSYLLPYAAALSGALFLYRYLDRRVNIWAVTNERLIDEWGILTHKSKENPLDKINDIVVEQTIPGRVFGYGSISVQTAAKAGETIIDFVERPEELKQTINEQKALRAEREDGPDATGGDRRRHTADLQTVLLHESVRPPFLLRCPHCGAERSSSITPGGPTATIMMRRQQRRISGAMRPTPCPSPPLSNETPNHQPPKKRSPWRLDQRLR
jgi:membrane protein YdbS with pleckstrin-like domain